MESFNTKRERPKFESTNGWVLPNGDFMECEFQGHNSLANKMGTTERELEKTAMKISQYGRDLTKSSRGLRGRPNFISPRESNLTKEQLDTLEEYCFFYEIFPPSEYFSGQEDPPKREDWGNYWEAVVSGYKK